jgi:hypothetical protein
LKKLADYVRWGVRFLDDDQRTVSLQIRDITFANRKIGLG